MLVKRMEEVFEGVNIKIVGVGGGGCNTVTRLTSLLTGVETIAVNTDAKHLSITNATTRLLIGKSITRGLGAGGFPEIGMKAAEESRDEIRKSLEGSHIVVLTAGMGGGTGTGAAPVVARIAKEQGALVLSFVTYPFNLERSRTKKADWGLSLLVPESDATVVIENDKLVEWAKNLPVEKAFFLADKVVGDAIKAIVETIKYPSLINLDYADLRTVMEKSGTALLAIGTGKGPNRIDNAVKEILNNPLLEADITGATGALVHIEGGEKMTIGEATTLAERVTEGMSDKGNVIFGARLSNNVAPDEIIARVIITGVKAKRINLRPKEEIAESFELEKL